MSKFTTIVSLSLKKRSLKKSNLSDHKSIGKVTSTLRNPITTQFPVSSKQLNMDPENLISVNELPDIAWTERLEEKVIRGAIESEVMEHLFVHIH